MAKIGKFAALAQFRQEPRVDDEVPLSADQPIGPVEASPADVAQPTAEVSVVPSETPGAVRGELNGMVELTEPTVKAEEVEEDDVRPSARNSREPTAKASRPRGRPPGKRSDPDWKLFSHFLKRSTQRQATAILFEQDEGRDLSDVLQNLLEKWVARERTKI